ncbi:MAG: hypothetical protein UW46_C0009G0008 [Candidatus Yanofskybacteria bacterium GW2011_GWF1_44_227]|uniref:Uncharacterized protein n=1 Tax=Candidatus Yanofskybacteria bacterium GW2011_GWE2_40_11 TaxID=1619033 RepID=A0A0G0T1D6_9BACT|nr:MAG: hypothetical protein UT69_C0019G0013 [Candidatus Yanofskybacteria bacterium GW2011_GWE1_40_10]KKR40930.1 MAG: hypothetical protein UT75_C0003G0060 [Candidatus Yanofskybacteria bacterium GW2011_GWE2_40_11]KKT15397.1 MAG: hypothetical protein UV97_C0007G0007 [Candidatus Yanofskybacteria bacterium GW2011_GWF2_43_596]KKT52905.1 MAG: hypothetical protein UW46_C0009G0008 [Candidatus Yanofskybacteria bacterium GW2011_GWF1_44_227]OGN36538.1 MAG: hypothetical protein A2241_02260 [Candidatus Yano
MFGLSRSREFPIKISSDQLKYAREQLMMILAGKRTSLGISRGHEANWQQYLFRQLDSQKFYVSMMYRIAHDHSSLERVDKPERNINEAQAMITAIGLIYAAMYKALGNRLPKLTQDMFDEYLQDMANFGERAFYEFSSKLKSLSGDGDIGLVCLRNINASGQESAGTFLAKVYIDLLLQQIEGELARK